MIRNALAALSMLIATATNSYAELENLNPITAIVNGGDKVLDHFKKDKEFNLLVADSFTIEEYAEWLKVRQSFEAKETKYQAKLSSCMKNGTDERTCKDPHWCLFPDKFNTNECVWYKNKYNLE